MKRPGLNAGRVNGAGASFQRHAKDGLIREILKALDAGPVLLEDEDLDKRPNARKGPEAAAWRERQKRRETLHNLITIGHARLDIRGDAGWAVLTNHGRKALEETACEG